MVSFASGWAAAGVASVFYGKTAEELALAAFVTLLVGRGFHQGFPAATQRTARALRGDGDFLLLTIERWLKT